jgi:lipopolysaccharide transport system permease protein
MGFSWFLSATGVFVRDIGQTIGLLMSVLLFVSPVFYPISSLPAKVQKIVMLNPLTLIIEESRNVLLYSKLPNWGALAIYAIISMILAWVGFWWFQKARKGFADVL